MQDLSQTETTTRTAAASALELKVSVNPLNLNVAEVEGTVTLAEAACEAPVAVGAAPAVESEAAPTEPASEVKPQGAPAKTGLAETGGGSMTPYLAGGAVALARRRGKN